MEKILILVMYVVELISKASCSQTEKVIQSAMILNARIT